MKIVLFLFRHGSTAGNVIKRYIGATDEKLCEIGRNEIENEKKLLISLKNTPESAAFMHILANKSKIYVSPLQRTQETAQILFPDNPKQIVPDFREMSFGAFEGKNAAEMEKTALGEHYRAWVESGCETKCPDSALFFGEDKARFSNRICNALKNLADSEKWQNGEIIPIVCHGGTINALLERFAVTRKGYFEWRTAHGAYRFEEVEL